MSKYSKEIQYKTRAWVGNLFIGRTYHDINERVRYINRMLFHADNELTLRGVIRVSKNNNSFTPPNCYTESIDIVYVDCGFDRVMTYEQFVFALPRIWYTTLFRLIQEWKAECSEEELAY